ncbi:hypothetical protein EUTSA_v10000485mg [Eutrema salsugineum]|uniref:DUF4219 domain-containing protein n=1 Tax=Eutrema salsugineum TaxID=72664 RepID=V4LVZ5_EUTSA|nr:hypothetical protein EUTSA_v10000485mg [Eutrema salsugineum]
MVRAILILCSSISGFKQSSGLFLSIESMGRVVGLGMKILNQSNYWLWNSCLESCLVSEDLWDVVGGSSTTPSRGDADHWKQQRNGHGRMPRWSLI